MTNHEMELHYTQSKCIYMEGHESCRIPVPVERCPLSKLSQVSILISIKLNNQFLLTCVTCFYPQLRDGNSADELQKVCSEHIASLVDLQWQLIGTESTGKASISGISLSQDMLDLVRMSPLQWGE